MLALTPGAVVSFKPHLRCARLPSGEVFLISETSRYLLPTSPMNRVADLIDGQRSLEALVRAAAPSISEVDVILALDELDAAGYLSFPNTETPQEEQAFWHELGRPEPAALGVPAGAALDAVSGVPSAWRAMMEDALAEAGVSLVTGSTTPQLRIALTPDYLSPELVGHAASARENGIAWLPLKPSGVRALMGPLFTSAEGPCWSCLVTALRRNRPVERCLERASVNCMPAATRAAGLRASLRSAFSLAAIAAAQHVFDASPAGGWRERLLELRFDSLVTLTHAVVRRPQCPVCGDARLMSRRAEAPVRLNAVRRSTRSDGGYRCCTPQETYERYRHLVSPVTGTVTHLGPMPGRHGPERAVYTCGYLVCPADSNLRSNVFDKACAGKGRSEEQARASALCEALERASSVLQGDEARVRSSQEELGASAVGPDVLQLFSERQLSRRDALNAPGGDVYRQVPAPFDARADIDWTPGWSLSAGVRRYVPLAYCYSETPADSGTRFCRHNPNGTASGNCLEEAILHGLLELVERDAAALWWYNEVPRPAVDLARFEDEFFDRTVADYATRGFRVWVLDLTHDLGIYTFAAVSEQPERGRFTLGLGCHLDARVAIQRALAELNQLFDPEGLRSSAWDSRTLRRRDFLQPDVSVRRVCPEQLPTLGGGDLRADIEDCIERLRRRDLELIVVDKTRPDIGASVAQAMVPGLRHFWPRFAPGRLYRVPYELGWVSRPRSEEDLNPVPLFL